MGSTFAGLAFCVTLVLTKIDNNNNNLTSEFYRAPMNEASKDADNDDIIKASAGNGDQSAATSSDIEEHLQPSKGTGRRQTKQLNRNADTSILTHHQCNLRSCNKKQTLSLGSSSTKEASV